MDPNADVETTATATVPVLPVPLRVGVAGAQTGDAYEQHAAEVHGFLVRTVRDGDIAADLLATHSRSCSSRSAEAAGPTTRAPGSIAWRRTSR
jgi:hypothetical protein